MEVTDVGVDTWSPCWYVDPDGPAASWLRERATVPSKYSWWLPQPIAGHRVGWFPGGMVKAEGHPLAGGLCPPSQLVARGLQLQESIRAAGLPLAAGERPFMTLGPTSTGFGGVGRLDATVNVEFDTRAEGMTVLAGLAAVARDAPGVKVVYYGPDRGGQTVELRGHAGKRIIGRCYDKGIESGEAMRGRLIRIEDQRRWGKLDRRMPEDLGPGAVRHSFSRRFLPLYRATKGVKVVGALALAQNVLEAVDAGELGPREAESLTGHMVLQAVAGRRGAGVSRRTMYRREQAARELGLVLADGVLEEVEVNVHEVLEAALESDLWECAG